MYKKTNPTQSGKGNKKGKEKQADFSEQISTELTIDHIYRLKADLDKLKRTLFQWSMTSGDVTYYGKKDINILKQYLQHHHDYYQYDQFQGSYELLPSITGINLTQITREDLLFKSFNLFNKAIWPIRFNSKFIAKLNDYNANQIFYTLGFVYYLACGNFNTKPGLGNNRLWGYVRPLQVASTSFNRFFAVKIFREKNIFVHIGVEKTPVVKNGVIKRYEYKSYMHFLDILSDIYLQNKNKFNERMIAFKDQIFNDVAKKDHSEELEVDMALYDKKKHYFFNEVYNQYTEKSEFYQTTVSDAGNIYYPMPFKPYYFSTSEMSTMIFDQKAKRWLSKDHLNYMERKKIAIYQKQINDSLIKRFVDFQSAKTLVQLLTKIPNFKINLTEQEKDVIGQNGNVLAIGRSGTGKTTCAILRLFSIEMLFKIRASIYKKKYEETVKDVRCQSSDIENTLGLHCIFLTASPVLTHEIQRYYKKLTDNIKTELEKKKQKIIEDRKRQKQELQKAKIQEQQESKQISFEQLNQSQSVQPDIKQEEKGQKKFMEEEAPSDLVRGESNKSAEEIEEQKEINKQFKDIQLKEDINNENFNEEEEDIDDLKMKFEENIKKFHNLYDLEEKDYPGFFTVKSFILMIDGVLPKPFFIRSKNTIINQDSNAAWHNERKGVMMIENYYRNQGEQQQNINIDDIEEEINYSDQEELQHEYLRQIQLKQKKDKQQLTKKLEKNKAKQILSFEVDYQYFVVHFWPRVVRKYYSASKNITPHLVWTEIYSTIKGSAAAHQYPTQFLTQNAYISTASNTFLTREEKLDIYETFCQYERWKIKAGGYDIMDAVNYILNYIRFRSYEGPEIHYVMIDEVQDLPHAIVYLFSKIATYGVFYSGDTAQTIAKGVGFRFCDLKSLFNPHVFDASLQLKVPAIKHLTINFRSHNNILQLANSIVSSIQLLFPKTIDRMKKEISDLNGPKPLILPSSDQQLLFYVLCGGEERQHEEGGNAIKKSPLEFGCDQVIIVRDQESKNKIPAMLQHALCLTIYQAKGLEFNDVILFNFFAQSPCPQKWGLLKMLSVGISQIPKQQYEKGISRHKMQQKPAEGQQIQEEQIEQVALNENFNKLTNNYLVKKIVNNKEYNMKKDINDYAELCSELKLLYTAITRPRKTLIIYDHGDCPARNNIEKLWDRLEVIEIITKELVLESCKKESQRQEVKIFNKIVASTDSNSWKQQGLKMYARGYFDQAMKCFQRSGHKELFKKAEANKHADDATKKLIEIESERNSIKQGFHTYHDMKSNDLAHIKRNLKKDEINAINRFKTAGKIFQELLMYKQAGQCYFSGKMFQSAFECFCKSFMHKQAAQSLQMMNKYAEAAEYYEKDDNYLKVIECLDLINEWVPILQKIHKFQHKMSEYEKQALLKKYSALALEQLVYQIQFQNEEEGDKPENNKVQIIEQKQSDEEQQWDSDEDPELAAERQFNNKLNENQEEIKQEEDDKNLIEIKGSIYQTVGQPGKEPQQQVREVKQQIKEESVSFSQLNQSSSEQPPQEGLKSVEVSFGDLNESDENLNILQQSVKPELKQAEKKQQNLQIISLQSSFSELNAKFEDALEPDIQSIKSLVDPDDIWVKNSISEIGKLQSEYSVVDDEENYDLNVKIIKTKGNIFVQDQIMKKIVNIVSIINSTVHEFFKQFKGYQSLITVSQKDGEKDEAIDNRPEISQFEDIDPKFINIILDTLESFKLFKLCLFVCNRYHLPSKAGRYLISLGLKYSTNCISNNSVNPILLAPSNFRKIEIEKGILASIALHAIYQNVNADFLKIKVTDKEEQNKNSLGSYFIQGLILEGLYKKAVFMVNPQESLKILANYNDFDAFKSIFNQKMIKKEEVKEGFQFPEKMPKTAHQLQYTKMMLKKLLFDISVAFKFESVSLRYYRQFASNLPTLKQLAEIKIPNYLPFTKLLLEQPEHFTTHFKSQLQKGYSILTKGKDLQVLDFIGVFLLTIHSQEHQEKFVKQFNNDQFLQFYRCSKHIQLAIKKFKGLNSLKIVESVLFMHQCYRIVHCKSMNFINDVYCFVQRTSTVANQLVQTTKVNAGEFAFFFQQDYNLILTKISRVTQIIAKKYQKVLISFYKKRTNFKKQFSNLLPEDFEEQQEEELLRKALNRQVDLLMDPKAKMKMKKSQTKVKKPKQKAMSYDFKRRNLIEYVGVPKQATSSEEQDEMRAEQFMFYRPNFDSKLKYMASTMIDFFHEHSKYSKQVAEGKELYCSGLNNYYREYTSRKGGFNLFDAIQFKKFKRIDLYADNILSVMDSLSLHAKHNFLAENLILLMIQYKSLEEPKGFGLSVTTHELKYFEGLQFVGLTNNEQKLKEKPTKQQINDFLNQQKKCMFEYRNHYSGEMDSNDIANIICDYLEILRLEQYSKFVSFPTIILSYVLNISNNVEISTSLRKIVNLYGKYWNCETLYPLVDCISLAEFNQRRKHLLEAAYKTIHEPVHTISVTNNSNLAKSIEDSEFDYEVEGRILEAKKKAASKIIKWWKAKMRERTDKKLTGNYLELAVEPAGLKYAKKPDTIRDIRLTGSIYSSRNILKQVNFLVGAQQAKDQLLSFLLTTTITSSLDFHFVLMTLNKIQQCRQRYFQYCSWDSEQIHEFDIQQIKQEMNEMTNTIQIWKKDEKWMREKNVNFKKKKVFEVKWMTKNLGLSNLIKKRAGLKKQVMLQKKKAMLKRIK